MTSPVDWQPRFEASPFAELFGDGAAAVAAAWGERPTLFTPDRCWRDLIDINAIEQWLDCSVLRPPYIEVTRDGKPLPLASYTENRVVARVAYPGYLRADSIPRLLEQGASVVFNSLDEWCAPARYACQTLAQATRCRVQAVVFVTPPETRCLPPHRDDADVLVLQLQGSKRWRLWELTPWTNRAASECADMPPLLEAALQAGQGLYVPMGTPHAATATQQGSIHLSFTLRPPRVLDALKIAVHQALEGVSVNDFLGGDAAQRGQVLEAAVRTLAERLQCLDASGLLRQAEEAAGCLPSRPIHLPSWSRENPPR